MAKSAKAPKKRATTKKTNKNVTATLADKLRNNRKILFVLAFAIVGVFALLNINAAPQLPEFSDDIVAGYINLTPTLVSKDEAGNLAYELYPSTTIVQADGTVMCDTGGSSGTVTTGSMSKGEVQKLQKDVLDTDVTSLANEIGFADQQAFVTMEGFMVAQGNEAKGTAVYPGSQKPESFIKAQAALQRACAKANRTVERANIKAPREPKLKQSNNKKTAFENIGEVVFSKVSACCNGGTRDTAYETEHFNRINDHRARNGRARIPGNLCIAEKAAAWSQKMAYDGKISHSTTYGNDAAACVPNWTAAGENVGVGYDNAGLFNAFVASATHNSNMLDKRWRVGAVGAVRKTNDNRIFVTQRFVAHP